MSRLFRMSWVFLLVLIISAPSWAYGGSTSKHKWYHKKSKQYGNYLSCFNYKKFKVWVQYRRLVRAYKRAGEDARQKFLGKIGLDQPGTSGEIQRIREEYEQQIAQLNTTISSNELQIAELNSTIASNDQQIADLSSALSSKELEIGQLNSTINSLELQVAQLNSTIASQNQQLTDLVASHGTRIDELKELCRQQAEGEYNRGLEEGKETCSETPSGSGVHPMVNSWSTGGYNPNTVEVDGAGNVFILDDVSHTVVRYDSSGLQSTHWGSSLFETPVDLTTDAQGNIYVLDQQSIYHLQKYNSDGTAIDMPPTIGTLEAPTGFCMTTGNVIYVADTGGAYGGRIVVLNSDGGWMNTVGEVLELSGDVYLDVAIDPRDNTMYLLTDSKVAVFSQYGTYQRHWDIDFASPSGLTIGPQGEIYVADNGSHQVFEFDAGGGLVDTFGADDLVDPGRHDVGGNGMIYVGDLNDQMIKVFQ